MADFTRRDFMLTTGGVLAAGLAIPTVHGSGGSAIRAGLIGCGGRGTGAAFNILEAADDVEVVAMADLFGDRLTGAYDRLVGENHGNRDRVKVDEQHRYVGFDAYERLLDQAEVDIVMLATPPHFRPMHIDAAVKRGVHVFTEKPVAVDPAGIRTALAAADLAREKNLTIVAGTQRRHERCYLEAMKRIQDGAIGEIIGASCYWNMGGLWVKEPREAWTDMEWQIRNWLYFTWLSGDHIVEQHVHNLDVCNWALGATPVHACGMGGRQVRTDAKYGHIFDHFAIEFEYPNGAHVTSFCRQTGGADSRVEERLHGTKGRAYLSSGRAHLTGENEWRFDEPNPNPYVQEHRNMLASIRNSEGLNELDNVANSTMTAIMGRTSAYTGKHVSWEKMMSSELDLSPAAYQFGPIAVPPVPTPGQTPLV